MTAGATRLLTIAHSLWRRLPPEPRRRAYSAVTRALAPAAIWTDTTPRTPREPYLVAGPLSAPTGLGQASRLVLAALRDAGREVSAIDLGPALMQPAIVPLPSLPGPVRGAGTLLMTAQPPTIAHSLAAIGRDILRDKLRVGLWAWEIGRLPAVWTAERSLVHAVAGPSRFVQAIFESEWGEPVGHAPWPLASVPAGAPRPGRSGAVVFGAAVDLGSTVARKNPFAVVAAFRAAFGPGAPVRLRLKLRDPASAREHVREIARLVDGADPPIDLLCENLSPDDLEAWWQGIDVFVSLHRAEGFGLLPAEAMQRGIPVIATDFSATAEFVSTGNGWPIPSRPVPARDETGRYELPGAIWAEPDPDCAVAALRDAAASRALIALKGREAAQTVARLFSAAAFVDGLERTVGPA